MQRKNHTKSYLKFNLLTLLFLSLFFCSSVFIQKVNADSDEIRAHEVCDAAFNALNEKFYFKSNVNFKKLNSKFNHKINDLEEAHKYINRLVKELKDPYTRFLTKEEFKDEQDLISSSFVGIGVKLASKKPVIINVLNNSPAQENEIKPNDYILRVNNKSTFGLNSSQVAYLMRGAKDTELTIKLKRGNEVLTKTLLRKELNFNVISSELLENNIALVKIDSFIPENTSFAFKDELTKLMSADGIILDLRNNSGGLMKNAIEIADMFLDEGKIVSTVSNSGKTNQYANSSKLYDSSLIVLVNENTASASEILASALRENNRAIIVGKKTFGKGLVQEIIKLPDESAMHITIAAYLTPNGNNINKKGLTPDETVVNDDAQLKRAKEIISRLKETGTKSRLASL